MENPSGPQIRNPPIVEAVLDIDCDFPPGLDFAAMETALRARFESEYPKPQTYFAQHYSLPIGGDVSQGISHPVVIQAYRFLSEDEKQIVQARVNGFSFNRLAPYTSLDDYLPEIERTWGLFFDLLAPVRIRVIRLRYINRILLPMASGKVNLDEFLKVGPRLPSEDALTLSSFFIQEAASENDTGHQISLVLAAQEPENERLPIILDITAASLAAGESGAWTEIVPLIRSLRSLKNRLFIDTLAPRCIELFQ
jgi:uncharacterized protein (TIGR04255 family)